MAQLGKIRIYKASEDSAFAEFVSDFLTSNGLSVYDSPRYAVFPGFCDVHVHFREPGFSYKETVKTGSMAAARGGYTAVCAMPNLKPVADSLPHLQEELSIINRDACINVYAYGAITVGQEGRELADIEAMAPFVPGFSDDGHGVQSEEMMKRAMQLCKKLGKPITAHCEDNSLLHGGYIHDGDYARAHGHRGICSESEWGPVARDAELVRETGCSYHVCHISSAKTAQVIREAKAAGINISCETAPHYLLMDDSMLKEEGRFKMNPPVRAKSDREALIRALQDGTIDCIATDHAPHTEEEKSRGLEKSAFGIVGLETAFPLLYTYLVRPGIISMEKLLELIVYNPRRRFSIPLGQDFSLWDMEQEYAIEPEEFLSMGRATPFAGWRVRGRCLLTVCGGRIVYNSL